jgi:multimeric flavodoxin WrbA
MKALILNGAERLRDLADRAEATLAAALGERGYSVTRHDLAALEIPDCQGDFGCWTVTPGICVHAGPHRAVARDLIQSDLVVWLSPVTFGGYSSALKRQIDHCIPLSSPLFASVEGESHHQPRYARFPSLLVVGLMERSEPFSREVFTRLVRRNVVNTYAPRFACELFAREDAFELAALVPRWLDELERSRPPHVAAPPLPLGARLDLPLVAPESALLLVGSPRGHESVSVSITTHLSALLAERGLSVGTERIHAQLKVDPALARLSRSLEAADLVVLSTPLYVDSLPAPVTEAFEILAERRAQGGSSRRPRFLAIINCGFPEAVHTDTGLAICRLFAEQAGLDWIGGLGVGGGGMLAGRPLPELGGRARPLIRALALTANAVAQGRIVPEEAQRLVRTQPIPAWMYRLLADWSFRQEARKHDTHRRLRERPYSAS